MSAHRVPAWLAVTTISIVACRTDTLGPSSTPPVFAAVSVAANPLNALSAVVTVRVRDADSVAVRFRLADTPVTRDSSTAAVTVTGDEVIVPVLGLLPGRRYDFRAVAYGRGGATIGPPTGLTTDTLPSDLPKYSTAGSDPTPGFVVFSAGKYGLAIDNTGRVVWYRRFPTGPGLTFTAEPNGKFYARVSPSVAGGPAPWVEMDPLGTITRTVDCARGLTPRFHDLIGVPDGTFWLLCDETRRMDLARDGGVDGALVTGTVVQHVSDQGALLFEWSPFDHFAITDGDPRDRAGPNVNWTHGNALDLASDGNLIVSFRNLGEITKIDTRTGALMWRLGGRRNQFSVIGASGMPFVGQHSARAYAPGAVMLLDNLGDTSASRAKRYEIDERRMTARLVRSYASDPAAVTEIGGSVQDLPSGKTLVSFGTAGRVEEYDASGRVVWRIVGNAGYVFRAQRIRSLYAPGVGLTR
jgi:hypothetical protein